MDEMRKLGNECTLSFHGDNVQNFTLSFGAFFSPYKYSFSFRLSFDMPCTSFWCRLKFFALFPHFTRFFGIRLGLVDGFKSPAKGGTSL